MSKLASTYAAACGLKLDVPEMKQTFYPLPFDRYITLQTGAGQAAKCYDYWQEVVIMLAPVLDKAGYRIVLLGGKDDLALQGTHDLRGRTSLLQSYYILKRGALHMGNDSWMAHAKGWTNGALVALYGSTSEANHGPYWRDPARTMCLSSHRGGGVPSYSAQENPKTINLIRPEEVANAVIKTLGLDAPLFAHETRFIGLLYNQAVFEVIPNHVPPASLLPGVPFSIRMDYHFDEQNLVAILQSGRKVSIITNREINLGILAGFRTSIIGYTHEIDTKLPLAYPPTIKSLIKHNVFYTREKDEATIAALRYHWFDVCTVEKATDVTKEDYLKAALDYANWPAEKRLDLEREIAYDGGTLRFKSNKYLLSAGKVHLSLAHEKRGQAITNIGENVADVIDDPLFFRDLNHCLLFHQPRCQAP